MRTGRSAALTSSDASFHQPSPIARPAQAMRLAGSVPATVDRRVNTPKVDNQKRIRARAESGYGAIAREG